MPTTSDLDNPHDQHADPLLHEAWEKGAQAARDGKDIGSVEGLYDDPDASMAFLDGYMAAVEGI